MSIDGVLASSPVLRERVGTHAGVRQLAYRDRRLCMLGGGSLVGLTEWDLAAPGGVRDIIREYLSGLDAPAHVRDIALHARKFRETGPNSVSSVLSRDSRFVGFGDGLWGLRDKAYEPALVGAGTGESSFWGKTAGFESFLVGEGRFPSRHAGDEGERALRLWWREVLEREDMEGGQLAERERLLRLYAGLPDPDGDIGK